MKKSATRKKATPKKKIKVDAMALFRAQDRARRSQFTTDGFDNFVAKLGINNDNTLSAGTYEFNLITRNRILLEAAYRGSWIVGRVIDSIAEDMTRAGIDLTTSDENADIPEFNKAMTKLQIWNSLCYLIKMGRLYGGALGLIQIKGQNLASPLNLDSIGKDQFQGIVVYDRWQLNPDLQEVIQDGPEIGLPKFYQIVTGATQSSPTAPTPTGQLKVHHSRVIRYTGIDLPFFQAITEMMWGESILERLWDRLISFDSTSMSVANLIERANNRTVGIEGLREIIGAGGEAMQGLLAQFEMMRQLQTNEGMTLLDKNDTFDAKVYTFSGLDAVLLQFGQQLAGASDTPLVRLFGQSPAGLSATGESDMRMYYDTINAQQKAKLLNPFDTLVKVIWRSAFGKPAPKDLEFTFTPLWQMSASDKATNAKTVTETVVGAFEAGVTTRKTALEELRDSSADTGVFANITDEEIEEADQEEPPLPDADPGEPEAPAPGLDPGAPDPAVNPSKTPVKNFDAAWKKIRRFVSPGGHA